MGQFDLNSDYRKTWFPKDHLTAVDFLQPDGTYTTFRVKIKTIIGKELMDTQLKAKKEKAIVLFEKGDKYLILNVSMANALADITGSTIPKNWIGKEVELFVQRDVHTPQGKRDVPRVRGVGKAIPSTVSK